MWHNPCWGRLHKRRMEGYHKKYWIVNRTLHVIWKKKRLWEEIKPIFLWVVETLRSNLGERISLVEPVLWYDFKWNESADLGMDGIINPRKSGVILVLYEGHCENTFLFSRFPCKKSVISWFPYACQIPEVACIDSL